MARLVYRPAALADLDAIYDFIEPDNPDRALGFVDPLARKNPLRRVGNRFRDQRSEL